MTKPNIILLMTDQQRWDSLGCNGNKFVSTPNIDRLAAGGANCTNSFTPWPVCTPGTRHHVDRRLPTSASGDLQYLQYG